MNIKLNIDLNGYTKRRTCKANKMNNKPVLSEVEWIVNSLGSRAFDTVSFLLINSSTHPPRNLSAKVADRVYPPQAD